MTKNHVLPMQYGAELDSILTALARCGFTTRQIVSAAFGIPESLSESLLIDLRDAGLVSVLDNYRGPQSCGGYTMNVYYLSAGGGKHIREHFPALEADLRPAGKLTVWERSRIYHELTVAKSYGWFQRHFDVKDFESERRMRRDRLLARSPDSSESLYSEAMGDFRIYARKKGSQDEFRWYQCEISKSLSARQISEKPDHLYWFVVDEVIGDLIRDVKGEKSAAVVNIGHPDEIDFFDDTARDRAQRVRQNAADLRQSAKDNTDNQRLERENSRYLRIYTALKKLGGVGTASAVAAVTGLDRATCSRDLAEFEKNDLLLAQRVGLGWRADFGSRGGAKAKLFHLGNRYPLTLARKRFYLFCSVWTVEMHATGLRPEGFDERFGAVFFSRASGDDDRRERLVIVVDDLSKKPEEIALKFCDAQREYERETIIKLHAYSAERFRQLAEKVGREAVNFWLPGD